MAIAKTGKLPRQNGTRQVPLPEEWWDRLVFALKLKDVTIEAFCRKANISAKTLQRSKISGLMSKKTLTALAVALGFRSTSNLLADWSERPMDLPRSLSAPESADLERNYAALVSRGIYDDAAELASTALARAEQSADPSLMAHWADRTADAYRAMGVLRKASSYYARAWDHIQTALSRAPSDVGLRYQAAKTRFGQIMVDDFLIRGAFREALDRHSHLLVEAQRLKEDADNEVLARDIQIRLTHIRRQQAEMLRLLGRYNEALSLIREVLADYPPSFYEERAYSRLSEADSLRLSGKPAAAVEIYEELEQLARDRRLDGFLGAVLWRLCCTLPLVECGRSRGEAISEMRKLVEQHGERYRFAKIYCFLAEASGPVHDRRAALRLLDQAKKFGPIDANYLIMEYAHLELCRGEILRTSQAGDACEAFEAAFHAYSRTECRWGQIRAWIGLQLTGMSSLLPASLRSSLEGGDRELLERFDQRHSFPLGTLSENLP